MDAPSGHQTTVALPDPGDAALLDAVFTHAPVGLAFWDLDRRFRRVNAALAEMNGVPAAEHHGRTAPEVLGALGEAIDATLQRVLAGGEPVLGVETPGETPAAPGRRRHWRASYYPVDDPHGTRLGVAAMIEDVTARVAAEQERAHLLREALTARARAEAAVAEADAARRRNEFLAAAATRIAASLDFEAALEELVGVAVPTLADLATLTVVGADGSLRAAAVACADPALARVARRTATRWPERSDALAGPARVVRTGEPELVREVGDSRLAAAARDEEHLAALRALGLRSWLIVPLPGRDRVIGALTLAQVGSPRAFAPEDVALASSLASRAALQLENARLSSERAEVAHTLQASLLPRALPDIPGLELAARYRAAGDATIVGGDFYDVFANGDGSWTALIGDVSGKGAEAAALTALMRHTLRAAAMRDPSPAGHLALLNDVLLAEGDGARFCTALDVRLELGAEGEVQATIASGGHLPPFLLRADGELRRLPVRGTLLGALPEPRFDELTVTLRRGDVLVLHTDGVTELRGAEPEEGERRLERVLARHAGRDAQTNTIAEAVERSAVGAQDGRPRDDIAVVALRVR
jgi:PAS domain S-box-containing protein